MGLEMILALNIDADRRAIALLQYLRIERIVAFHGRDIGKTEVRVADGRQSTDHRQHRIHAVGHVLAAFPGCPERFFHGGQHASPSPHTCRASG